MNSGYRPWSGKRACFIIVNDNHYQYKKSEGGLKIYYEKEMDLF